MTSDKTFVKITNKDIYVEMKKFNELVIKQNEENTKQHNEIIKRQDRTNGKVILSKWIATTALLIALGCIGYIFAIIAK